MVKLDKEALWEIDYLNKIEEKKAETTPDHLKLAQYSEQYLFVVDNLKKNQPKHWFMKDMVEKKCEAYTVDNYVCHNYNLGAETYVIPILHEGEKSPLGKDSFMHAPPAIISGELFLVNDYKLFEQLDRLRDNTVKFERKRVDIQIPYRRTKWLKDVSKTPPELIPVSPTRATTGWYTHHMKAFMYVAKREYWDPLLDGGYLFSPTKLVKPNSEWVDEYYLFNNR